MKKPVALIFLALGMPVCAQNLVVQLNESEDSSRSEFEYRDSLFSEIELETVETGFLLEYSLFAEDPLKHTGTDGASVLNTDRWRMLYGGLQRAVVNSRAIKLPGLKELNSEFKEMSKEDKIILPVLWFKYNCFKDETVSVSSNGIKKLDENNTNLFKSRELFAIAPSVKKVKGRDFKFLLSPDFIFTNMSTRPERLIVDFDDEKGNTEIKPGETAHVNYSSAGVKKITVYYDTPEGNRLRCTSVLDVDIEEVKIIRDNSKSTSVPDITGEKTGRVYQGATATIEFEIFLSYTNSILDKPFFVLEGFDPYNEFVSGDLYDKLGYAGLRDSLFDEGYDLVLVNYVNGSDYIQRNAFALEELIKYVNNLKNVNCLNTYENVIMGFSMGGLVARYALKDMENRSENHDTRLYISYDSPHRGANVPIGYQQLVKEMYDFQYLGWTIRDEIPEIEDAYSIMISPAAIQMLMIRAFAANSFINELAQMGMPQQCRNIALGNGSMQGINYPDFEPAQKLLDLHYELDIIGNLWHFILDANCYALADNPASPERVCEWYFKVIFWQGSVLSVASLPYDNAPGGIYDLESFGINLNALQLPEGSSLTLTSTGFCFVPTASAFDIPISATSLQASITSQTSTSFTDFFINDDSDNELHIDLTSPKVNWILQQIDIGDVIDCDGSCLSVSGSSTVCPSSTEFTINNLPSGATINWTCSQNITRISSQGSNPCQFEPNTSGEYGWINATITFNGNQFSINQLNVWVGSYLPYPLNIEMKGENYELVEHTNDYWELCPNTTYRLVAHTQDDVSQWDWTIPESWEFLSSENSPEVLIQTGDYILWEDIASLDVYFSPCASWIYSVDYLYVTEPPFGCGELLKVVVFPNPAKNSITLQLEENELAKDNQSNFNISIVDNSGRIRIIKITKENQLNIDVSSLPRGEYTIVISNGKTINSHRFIKSN